MYKQKAQCALWIKQQVSVLITKTLRGTYRRSKGIHAHNIHSNIIHIKTWGTLINLIEISIGRPRAKPYKNGALELDNNKQ